MTDLLLILLVSLVCFLFWQQRRQAELARIAIARRCDQLNLQLISTSLAGYKLKLPNGQLRLHAVFYFEFSACGDDYYQGQLLMVGFRASQFFIPPYRIDSYSDM